MTSVPQDHSLQFGIDYGPDEGIVSCGVKSSRLFQI